MRIHKKLAVLLAVSCMTVALPALADDDWDDDDERDVRYGRQVCADYIGRQRAAAIALSRVVGRVKDIDLEYSRRWGAYYDVEIKKRRGRKYKVKVNARNGHVISIRRD